MLRPDKLWCTDCAQAWDCCTEPYVHRKLWTRWPGAPTDLPPMKPAAPEHSERELFVLDLARLALEVNKLSDRALRCASDSDVDVRLNDMFVALWDEARHLAPDLVVTLSASMHDCRVVHDWTGADGCARCGEARPA